MIYDEQKYSINQWIRELLNILPGIKSNIGMSMLIIKWFNKRKSDKKSTKKNKMLRIDNKKQHTSLDNNFSKG